MLELDTGGAIASIKKNKRIRKRPKRLLKLEDGLSHLYQVNSTRTKEEAKTKTIKLSIIIIIIRLCTIKIKI